MVARVRMTRPMWTSCSELAAASASCWAVSCARFWSTGEILVDDGDRVGVVVISEGVGSDERLTALDCKLGSFEMRLELRPGFLGVGLVVPFGDVAAEDSCARENDEADVDELFRTCCGSGGVRHADVLADGGE